MSESSTRDGRVNRRNYYRILHVQPDAPASVIKGNYRTMQQKMRAHPDLGGDHWNAALINEAYATLRNPVRRRSYDLDLLQRYDIALLSMGGVAPPQPADRKLDAGGSVPGDLNQRNYYRILQVQPDAPQAIIAASFRTLEAALGSNSARVREAFAVLRDPARRSAYDKLLGHFHHDEAVRRMNSTREPSRRGAPVERDRTPEPALPNAVSDAARVGSITIAHYCPFCKTPANATRLGVNAADWCVECHSPLPPPRNQASPHFSPADGRDAMRLEQGDRVQLFAYWPSTPIAAVVQNVSATGASILARTPVDVDATLKIDSEHFTAIGQVIRCAPSSPGASTGYEIGVSFLSARFVRTDGNFLNVTA